MTAKRKIGRMLWLVNLGLCMAFHVAGVDAAPAADTPGATVQELLAWVEQRNPELKAMEYETEAAAARVEPAGALEDPTFAVELRDIPRGGINLSPDEVGSTKYTISQKLPFWGKRGLKQEIAEAEAEQARGRQRTVAAELRARVKTSFAQYYQAVHAAHLTAENLDLTRELERLARTRYANGLSPQQDVIRAQAEQTALRTELVGLNAELRQAHARLNTAIGRPAAAPLAEPRELARVPAPAVLEGLAERAQRINPQLFTQTAQITAAERARLLTLRNRYPDLRVAVSAIQEDERLNAWELMLEVDIPLQQGARRAQEQESAALLAAAQTRLEATTLQVLGELQEALAGLEGARQQAQLLDRDLQPQAELTFRSALASYQTGTVDFATLLEALRQIRQANLNALKAEVEQRIRLAEIERLVGEDL